MTKKKLTSLACHRPVGGKRINPVEMLRQVCAQSGLPNYLKRIRADFRRTGLTAAVANHDNQFLFDWLMGCFSFQGVSDAIASKYIEDHGNVTYDELAFRLSNTKNRCPKLMGFEAFIGCGYRKTLKTCANPKALPTCPVPTHNLRKGQLNQAAYGLFFFITDLAQGDLVRFIDDCLASADRPGHPDRVALMAEALTGQLVRVIGISHKLINMTFADLLIGAAGKRTRWVEVGASMIAVDTLVHNFLRRTGIHYCYETSHGFGQACYGTNGCAEILDDLARQIDCSEFDSSYPIYFPRYLQHAIWRFCASDHLNICNGNTIDDQARCDQKECPVFSNCGRVTLKPT